MTVRQSNDPQSACKVTLDDMLQSNHYYNKTHFFILAMMAKNLLSNQMSVIFHSIFRNNFHEKQTL